ncbi:deoxynucleotidyltransferase terminal-interacting protein 2 [Drosophila guanche]|uniref:Blast:Deoxynucleotidyltransferase terminal-interacting protein 2 n=1 Tax=Drosophila guanche TaxID=7266 RepID=A0A3B0KIF8_DROGU|nr:deoxynucleotidyltransferase terminal-interacting protein 2 [Drosophila guanche]SPP85546.1 blast:Deoxynucleotidyltransferase terminal-interacting protein 2 [Drosophila guanche]
MDSIFLVDKTGNQELQSKRGTNVLYTKGRDRFLLSGDESGSSDEERSEGETQLFGLNFNSKDISDAVNSSLAGTKPAPSKVALQLDEMTEKLEAAVDSSIQNKKGHRKRFTELDCSCEPDLIIRTENVEKDMLNSRRVLDPGLAQRTALPCVGKRKQTILNRAERAKTKGSGWFDLPATEVTEEMRNELKIIQMRSVLNPKQFYKKNDLKVLPKYFQIGTVQHSALDHYKEKNTRKAKKSLVDQLLEDEAFQKFNKRKYNEVIQRTDKYAHRKAMKKMKKLKKNK